MGEFMRNQLLTILLFSLSFKCLALVNYSKKTKSLNGPSLKASQRSKIKRSGGSIMFDLETETFTNRSSRGKFDLYKAHLGTSLFNGVNFYLKSEFGKNAQSDDGLSFGNSEMVAVVDWMGSRDRSNANLFVVAGLVLPGSKNGIGHDRNDQMLGVVTQKNFGMMSASASFIHFFLGESELTTLSSYNRAEVKFAYSFSALVKFGVDVSFISTKGLLAAQESLSFSEYSPYLHVGLSPRANLKIGAKYASKNSQNESFESFRQWDIGSFTGNSIYASLGFSL